MAEKFTYKFISLIIAILVYIAVLFGIYQAIFEDEKKKKDYGFNVKDAIVVNIDTLLKEKPKPVEKPKPKTISPQIPVRAMPLTKPEKTKTEETKTPEKSTEVPEPEKKQEEKKEEVKKESRDKVAKSAKDLFSTVRTDKFKKAMEDKRKEIEARASRLRKQKAEKARKKAEAKKARERAKREARRKRREAQKLLEELEVSQSSSKHLKKGEEHAFWSFVANKIMAKWSRTVATQDGLKGYATIRIDNKGRLTYRNLKLSGNSLFDTKLKVFLDNLEYERFPACKDGPYKEEVFEFKDQEKGL